MTKTEQQLRDALTAIADLVQPTEPSRMALEHPKRRHSQWLGPVSVAATIMLIVTIGIAASQRLPGKRPTAGPATTTEAAMQPVAPTGPARFFAVLQATVVKVYNASTGAPTQTVPNPPDANVWTIVSATHDDRLFLLSGYNGIGASSKNSTDNPRLYWLRLDANGKISSLSRVSGFHSTQHLLAMAVSPDGTRVAYALPIMPSDPNGETHTGIAVLNLATRHTQTFSSDGDIRNLSWADDGRHLAFFAGGTTGHDGIWILDTQARPSKNLYAASRLAISWGAGPFGMLTTPLLSADGSKIYVIAAQTERPTGGPSWTRLIEIDAATGRQLRVLYQEKYSRVGADGNVTWQFTALTRDTGSEHLLISSTGYAYRIDIKTTHTVRTPIGPMTNDLAW